MPLILTISMPYRKYSMIVIRTIFLSWLVVFFAGCSTIQSQFPVKVSTPIQTPTVEEPETFALDQEGSIKGLGNPLLSTISDPWILVDQSHNASLTEKSTLLLAASDLFLAQGHISTAFTLLEQVEPNFLPSDQKAYYDLTLARYAFLTGDLNRATSLLLQSQSNGAMQQANIIRWLKLDIGIASRQQNFSHVVLSRLELDQILRDFPSSASAAAQLQNQRQILNILTRQDELFAQQAISDSELNGWLSLAILKQTRQYSEPSLSLWQQRFPNHLARIDELNRSDTSFTVDSNKIALLLPLSSKLGRAAQAFKSGFEDAVRQSGRFDTSRVYDIGAETDFTPVYYQSAVNDGADFIIGPLGKASVGALLQHLDTNATPGVSTLILGSLTAEQAHIPNIWGLALSPEQDAIAAAERAISQGLRHAIVLEKSNPWGARVSQAFTTAFEAKGGRVVGRQRFLAENEDHSTEIKNVLNINSSEIRHIRLENLLGSSLEFSVRRRNDIDFIFLAGNAKDARRIIPLVKFYRAHKLPIFATSSTHSGKFNKLTDEDMKGLSFSELPWLLTQESFSAANSLELSNTPSIQDPSNAANLNDTLPYQHAALNRLYALGFAAFETIPEIGFLRADSWYQYDSQTMLLNMDQNRNIQHEVAWGEYTTNGISVSP